MWSGSLAVPVVAAPLTMQLLPINVRCWRYRGDSALEDMVLGMDECAVRDQGNQLSSEEFDECLALVFCQIQDNYFAHLGQIVGHYKGHAAEVWDRSRGAGPGPGATYEMKSLTRIHRVPTDLVGDPGDGAIQPQKCIAVVHYLLDMG